MCGNNGGRGLTFNETDAKLGGKSEDYTLADSIEDEGASSQASALP